MPKLSTEPIYVGCELIVNKQGKILLGLRGKACYGANTWGLPGGHLEFSERLSDALCREAEEEVGAQIMPRELKLISVVDGINTKEKSHHVHISFELKDPAWEPRVMEPDSCIEWRYFGLDALPSNIFPPHVDIIRNYQDNVLYRNQ
jgi:8-oxo-dGTP diphosphatase